MITAVLIAVVVLLIFGSSFFKGTRNYPPELVTSTMIQTGPFQWPVIGNLSLLKKLSRTFGGQHCAFVELSRRYDSDVVSLRLGASNVIVVSGQIGVQKVLHSEEYDGRPWNEFIKLRNFGNRNGITMVDGPKWQEMRAWVVRKLRIIGMGRRQMSDLMMEELNEVMKTIKGGGIYRLKQIIAPAVINVLWSLITGKRFCDKHRPSEVIVHCDTSGVKLFLTSVRLQHEPKASVASTQNQKKSFRRVLYNISLREVRKLWFQPREALQYFIDLMERRSRAFDMSGGVLSALPWIRHIAPERSGYNILNTINNEMRKFLMETIDEHKRNYTPDIQDDLIYMFLNEMYSDNSSAASFTDDQLVMVIMDLFIAGSNTTTATLDFLFLNMVIHQDVQKRLHEEIDEVVGTGRAPDLNDRPRLAYTEAVLAESQRVCPIAPLIGPRRVLKETNLLGYVIPKNVTVIANVWSIHMNEDLYPEPESFKPERFLKNGVYLPNEKLILFGEGKRRCPGEALARCGLFLLFVGVMQQYHLLPVPGQEPPTLASVPGLVISPKPYDVLLTPRRAEPRSFDSPN